MLLPRRMFPSLLATRPRRGPVPLHPFWASFRTLVVYSDERNRRQRDCLRGAPRHVRISRLVVRDYGLDRCDMDIIKSSRSPTMFLRSRLPIFAFWIGCAALLNEMYSTTMELIYKKRG